jgi:hypothetical protein
MSSERLKSFLVEHPKLCEFVFTGTMLGGTIGVEIAGAKGYPGP